MKLLVLGASGFIGSYFKKCIENDKRFDAVFADVVSNTDDVYTLDVTDSEQVRAFLEKEPFDQIWVLAGVSGAAASFTNYGIGLRVNLEGMLNLLSVVSNLKRKPLIVFPSSRLVYAADGSDEKTEGSAINPLSLYGIHKFTVEQYLRAYHNAFGVPYIIFRISIPYGEFHVNKKPYGIVNSLLTQAIMNKKITLFGDGEQKRDFIHLQDMYDIWAAIAVKDGTACQTYNLGGTECFSLKTLAGMIQRAVPCEIEHVEWSDLVKAVETGDMRLISDRAYAMSGKKPAIDISGFIRDAASGAGRAK